MDGPVDDLEILCEDEAATRRLGECLGAVLAPGTLVGLIGPLGAGKTLFVQGLARGLGVPPDVRVCSPTYAYVHEYAGRMTLHHLDLYRIASAEDFDGLGLSELYEPEGVCVVEWFDRVPEAHPPARLEVRIEAPRTDPEARRVRLRVVGGQGLEVLRALTARWAVHVAVPHPAD